MLQKKKKKNTGRTNSISEGFNNKFKKIVSNWMFIEAIQRFNYLIIIKLLNIKTGIVGNTTQISKYEKRITNIRCSMTHDSEIKIVFNIYIYIVFNHVLN